MAKEKHRIVIAEDYTILREGLRALIYPDFNVIAEAGDGHEAIMFVEKFKPHLVLMDLSMPRMNGIDAIREIRKRVPETKIVVLTIHKTEEYILATLKAGADGYVLKDATHEELIMAAKNVLRGKRYLSPGISEKVIEGYLDGKKTIKPQTSWDTLTHREREVLKLIAEGYGNKQISEYLCISVKTVDTHRANLMKKIDLHNVQAPTALAFEKGLVDR
jgi:DNA-binding NarL/FixJ family response regulator